MNKDKVLNYLKKHKKPMSAYQVLDGLRNSGFKAPISVYRALDKLIEDNQVHKVNIKSCVVCNHQHNDKNIIFNICKKCKRVFEGHSKKFDKLIQQLCQNNKFQSINSELTIQGYCSNCK